MSKTDKKIEKNGDQESVSTKRLPKFFSSQPDLLLNSMNQRPQTNKKSYTPNLNVTRNKISDEKKNDKDSKKESSSRVTRQQKNKDRGNKRNAPQIIQTHGFLSEGIAGASVQKRFGGGDHSGSSLREVNTTETLVKPRIVKTDIRQIKENLEVEKKVLNDFLLDDDSEIDEDSKTSSTDDIVPVKIKNESNRCNESFEVYSSTNIDVKIKVEPLDYDNEIKNDATQSTNGHDIKFKEEPHKPILIPMINHRMEKLFNSQPNQILLFQMPDSIPGTIVDENEENSKPSTSSDAISNSIKSNKPKLCSLEHLEDGFIGKLIRHKSGKVKLLIGDTVFDVDPGLQGDFLQNVVTIESNPQQRSANMYSLGSVSAKYKISPDWDWLFEQVEMKP